MDVVGGVVRLNHSQAVAKVQHAAAERILELTKLGAAMDQAASPILQSIQQRTGQHLDALATMATGLGSQIDVYA